MVQSSEGISIDWFEGSNLAICVFPACSVMPISCYLGSYIERHAEHIVDTPIAGFATRVALTLLLQRGFPDANETWRQITPEIQAFRLLFGWLMVDLPNLSTLPEAGVRYVCVFKNHAADCRDLAGRRARSFTRTQRCRYIIQAFHVSLGQLPSL